MNVNPEDYDPEELRQMAAERRAGDRPEGRGRDDDPTRRGDDPETDQRGDDAGARRNGVAAREPRRGFHSRGSPGFEPDRSVADRPTPGRGNPEPTRGRAADALRSNQLEQLFLHQSSMVTEEMTKPYLGEIPQKYAAERVIFDWLEFLVLKGGFKRTMNALRYYRTIDWITEDVEASLQDYLIGFSDGANDTTDLDVDDHQLSLVYVARLASMS
ncbi:FlaD/FlaE family flagellar protein [Salinigranum sp. GCM10025319]|uniref:FlaD/FlaE family flagellar protein n=1 Tax=Salinigranum sp. GCM10025319 TaxID=3252687 RepID=UPI003622DA75